MPGTRETAVAFVRVFLSGIIDAGIAHARNLGTGCIGHHVRHPIAARHARMQMTHKLFSRGTPGKLVCMSDSVLALELQRVKTGDTKVFMQGACFDVVAQHIQRPGHRVRRNRQAASHILN